MVKDECVHALVLRRVPDFFSKYTQKGMQESSEHLVAPLGFAQTQNSSFGQLSPNLLKYS